MGSNSSSIVITFSIAILLLLVLLLLLSYNSKAKNDSVERFETPQDNSYSDNYSFAPYNSIMDPSINNLTMVKNPTQKKSVASNDTYKPDISTKNENFGNMLEGSPLKDNYSLLNNDNNTMPTSTSFEDPTTCFKRDRLTANDLLPADASSKWSQINPSSSGELVDQNFLTAGYHIGVNTIGQSMRNANLQLRSEIPNPQVAVSPWLISTIEPDIRPVSFEIGSAPTTPPS
jgi:hypothetical protein